MRSHAANPEQAGPVLSSGFARVGPHRLYPGDQGLRAQAGQEVPYGTVLHPRLAARWQGERRQTGRVYMLVVCPGRERWREHRPRGRGGGGFARVGAVSAIGGISIVKPKESGGVTAYDLNSGDKKWWVPNGNL